MELDALKHIECIYSVLTSDVLDHLKVGVAVLDGDMKVTWANQFLTHDLCGQNESVMGLEISEMLLSVSESVEQMGCSNVSDQLCKGEKVILHVGSKENGGHKWVEHRLSPIRSDMYNEGWIGYFYDITDQIKYHKPVSFFEKYECISPEDPLDPLPDNYPLDFSESTEKQIDFLLEGEVDENRINAIKAIQSNNRKMTDLVCMAATSMGKTEYKFKTIFDKASDSIIILDLNGNIREINQVICDSLDYSYFELLGMDHSLICNDPSIMESIFLLKNSSNDRSILLESFCTTRNGVNIPVELNCRLIEYEGRSVVLITARDLSERRRIEHLSQTNKELVCLHDTKDVFVDILRHDLMNPAGIIKGYVDLLSKNTDDPILNNSVRMIRKNNNKIIDLIEAASKYAKLESIEDIGFERLDLMSMLNNVVEDFEPHSNKKSIDVSIAFKGDYYVYANKMVETIFVNYVSNAIKYSPEGSKVVIDVEDQGDCWKLIVTDNGIGVLDVDKPFVFERFTRLNTGHIKGAGLGLAIVKKIAELHDGSVGVDNVLNEKGCAFWVTLKKSK